MNDNTGAKRNWAYLCFGPPALLALLSNSGPSDPAGAAGMGFFMLIPLALISLVSLPVAIGLMFAGGRDIGLYCALTATAALPLVVTYFDGSPKIQNLSIEAYGAVVLFIVVVALGVRCVSMLRGNR